MVLHVVRGKGSQQQGVVELTLGKGGLGAKARLVTHLEARHRVGVGREALIAAGERYAAIAECRYALFGEITASVIHRCPRHTYVKCAGIIFTRVVGVNIPHLATHTRYLVNLLFVLGYYKVRYL